MSASSVPVTLKLFLIKPCNRTLATWRVFHWLENICDRLGDDDLDVSVPRIMSMLVDRSSPDG